MRISIMQISFVELVLSNCSTTIWFMVTQVIKTIPVTTANCANLATQGSMLHLCLLIGFWRKWHR